MQKPSTSSTSTTSLDVPDNSVVMGLDAAIVAMVDDTPQVLTVKYADPSSYAEDSEYGLPSGPFEPHRHSTLEIGLRSWVEELADLQLGYVEQL